MIPLQWVTATWFMFVCMIMGAPVPIVLIAVVCLHGDVQISEAYRDQYIGKMLEKLDDMKGNTL